MCPTFFSGDHLLSLLTNRYRYILLVTLCYAAGSGLWIVVSDSVVGSLANAASMAWLSTVKGLFFVVVTTLLLFLSLRAVPNDQSRQPVAPSVDTLLLTTTAWSVAAKYLFSIAMCGLMLMLRQGIEVSFAYRPLLILFMFPIILSAMIGGLGPGLLATAISALGINFLGIPPLHSLSIGNPYDLYQWCFLIGNGLLASILSEGLHRLRRSAEASQLHQSVTLASIGDGVITTDANGAITFLNPEAERMTGWQSADAAGKPLATVCQFARRHKAWPLDSYLSPFPGNGEEFRPHGPEILISRDGRQLPVQQNVSPITAGTGKLLGTVLVIRDDSARSQTELRLLLANRTLRVLSMTNQALLHAESEQNLFHSVCDFLVKEGGFAATWIGMADDEGPQRIRPLTWSGGRDNDRFQRQSGCPDGGEDSPWAVALRTKQPCMVPDILRPDAKTEPWREEARQNGFHSMISLPLVLNDSVLGILSIYSTAAHGFSDPEITVLSEMTNSLAHGIATLRLREKQTSTMEALRQERDFAETLIHTSPAIVLLLDRHGRILRFNPYLATLSGWALDEVRGQCWFDTFIPARNRERVRSLFQHATHGTPNRGVINPILTRDGRERMIEWYSTLLSDSNDDSKGPSLLNIGLDVTERLEKEAVIREQDTMLREMSAMARIGAWRFDPATGEGTWTEEVARIHDLPPEQQTNKEIGLDFFHGEWRQRIEAAVACAVEDGTPYDLELEMITAAGRRKWVRTIGSPVIDDDGQVVAVRGSLQDITDRKIAEMALRQSERIYRSLVDNMLNSVARCRVVFDNDQPIDIEYLAVNPAFFTTTGISVPVEGRRISEVIPGYCRDNPDSLTVFGRVARTGEPTRWEHYLASLDRWFSFSIFSNAPGEIVIIAENITVRKKAELELRDSLAEKVSLLKEIHHRVKNNLQIVASLLSLQADRIDNPLTVEALRETRNRVRSMALLHETLYRAGNLARINLASYFQALSDQLLRSFGPVADRVRIRVEALPIEIPLEQAVPCGLIVNELISNALKHAFPGNSSGEITLELSSPGDGQLRLRVFDTGVGLPPGLDRLANVSTLGLQLVNNLTGQLRGQLSTEPPPGGGAGFTVFFPAPQNRNPEVS